MWTVANTNWDYVHTESFSLAFYIVLRPQGIRKQMKTLRKRHRVHIAWDRSEQVLGAVHTKIDLSWIDLRSISVRFQKVFTQAHLHRSWIDLSSHLSVHIHIQIALDLDRSQITSVNGALDRSINECGHFLNANLDRRIWDWTKLDESCSHSFRVDLRLVQIDLRLI